MPDSKEILESHTRRAMRFAGFDRRQRAQGARYRKWVELCPHTGTPYSLLYIIQEFIEHDQHHKVQIDKALLQS